MGDDAVFLVELQRDVEAVAQLGEILQGSSQEGHVATDGMAAGKAADRLVRDGLEDGRRDVCGGGTLV